MALQEMHAILFGEAKANKWDKRDLQRRAKHAAENKMHAALLKFWKAQAARILNKSEQKAELTADYLERYFERYGAEEANALYELVYPLILDNALEAAKDQAQALGVSWQLTNDAAAQWAREYTLKLSGDLTNTTKQNLAAAVADYIDTSSQNLGDLADVIQNIMGANEARANMIAVTEVTRAYAEGNTLMWKESGLDVQRRWNTNNDDLVCTEICEPNNNNVVGLDEDVNGYDIPAHVNCRCWWTPVVNENG